MSELIDDAGRMAALFRGFSGSYGTYDARFLGSAKGKQKVRQSMVKEPPTIDLFKAHLSGQTPIGIYMLDDNEQVSFGAIDIDQYPIDHGALTNRLDQMSLPLIVCNSKSGGAHVYVFFESPQDPAKTIEALKIIAEAIGYPGVEVFPKQAKRPSGGYGNYINLPFFGHPSLEYSCYTPEGEAGLSEFLVLAERNRTTIGNLKRLISPQKPTKGIPAAENLELQRLQAGGRNEFLFYLGTDLMRQDLGHSLVATILREKNQTATDQDHENFVTEGPLHSDELEKLIANLKTIEPRQSSDKSSAIVEELNAKHAHVMISGKARIINTTTDPQNGWQMHDFSTPADFRSRHANRKVKVGSRIRTAAEVWLESPKRRSYNGITFLPGKDAGDYFNLFQGFAVEPAEGDCRLYFEHIRNNICSADDELYDYIIHWMADAIQNPSSRPGVALAIRGQQGVGKGVFVNMFARLFGPHFIQVTQSSHLVGNFNGHQKDKLLVFADEAFWAGNKQAEGVLKGLVTEDTLSIEMKGVDVGQFPNFIRLILATNNDWVVPASAEQRRFVVIDASAARMQDTAYFGAIIHQMENGGIEALMHHLQSVDLAGVNLRKIPQTDALADQKLRSLDSVAAWLFSCLDNGGIEEVETSLSTHLRNWPETCGTTNLYNAYLGYCKRVGQSHPVRDTVFGKCLAKYLPSMSKRREGGKNRQQVYLLPSLDTARQEFALTTKILNADWTADREDLPLPVIGEVSHAS
jgi:hypothetical protein